MLVPSFRSLLWYVKPISFLSDHYFCKLSHLILPPSFPRRLRPSRAKKLTRIHGSSTTNTRTRYWNPTKPSTYLATSTDQWQQLLGKLGCSTRERTCAKNRAFSSRNLPGHRIHLPRASIAVSQCIRAVPEEGPVWNINYSGH